jgi:hypothetical protein
MYQLGQARCTRYNSSVIKFVSDLRQIGGFLLVHRHPFLQITVAEYTLPVQVGTYNIMIIIIIFSRHLNSVSTACDKHKIKDIHPNLPSVVCNK